MFLALRELATARGRFALIGSVVALITLLLVMLSGLTEGLSKQNTSALDALGQEYPQVTFSTPQPSFSESQVRGGPVPLGTGQTRMEGHGGVAVLGLPAGTPIPGSDAVVPAEGAVLSRSLAGPSDVDLGGTALRVRGSAPDLYYSHSPVVWVSTATWRSVTHAPEGVTGTALLGREETADSVPMKKALSGLASYSSERGSLLTMQAFLYGISALVTVAFLSIWTMQRTRDLSILRALGAGVRYLLRDALSQSALVLAAGVGAGTLLGLLLGLAARQGLPFELSASTVAVPAAGIWLLGMAGAWIATRRITRVNPLDALGGNA